MAMEHLELESYNHVYELLAGVHSLSFLFEGVRDPLLERFSIEYYKVQQLFFAKKNNIEKLKTKLSQFKKFVHGNSVANKIHDTKRGIRKSENVNLYFIRIQDRLLLKPELEKYLNIDSLKQSWITENNLHKEHTFTSEEILNLKRIKFEQNIIERKIFFLSFYTFLYCITIIIVAGLQKDKFVDYHSAYSIIATLNLLTIILLISGSLLITFFYKRVLFNTVTKKRMTTFFYKPTVQAILCFIITLFISVFWVANVKTGISIETPQIIFCSFFICVFPYFIFFCRAYLFYKTRYYTTLWYFKINEYGINIRLKIFTLFNLKKLSDSITKLFSNKEDN